MAATIVTTPSLGASDWSNFITQVAGLKKGFMQLSYTNFYSTAVSAIATGSVMEVNGSFYQFTETAIDYSGTTSANADLYIYAQPSAGGTTLTIAALTAACVWVDSKQGFYASAASNNRAMGGMYVQTAATYYHKYLYEGGRLSYCLETNRTRPLLSLIMGMGEWDMNTGPSGITVQWASAAVGIVNSKVRRVTGVIYNDAGDGGYNVPYMGVGMTVEVGFGYWFGSAGIFISRRASGLFASTSFDGTASTVPNRGYVIVTYEA